MIYTITLFAQHTPESLPVSVETFPVALDQGELECHSHILVSEVAYDSEIESRIADAIIAHAEPLNET